MKAHSKESDYRTFEPGTFSRHSVKVGRLQFGMAINAEVTPSQVVCQDDNNIGPLIRRSGLSQKRRHAAQKAYESASKTSRLCACP